MVSNNPIKAVFSWGQGLATLVTFSCVVATGSCAAHAAQSFNQREAQLNSQPEATVPSNGGKDSGLPLAHVQTLPAPKHQLVVEQTETTDAPETEEPVSSETFAKPQNPQNKPLKAALTCGKLVLKKGGKADCFAPVRMWREDVEITCDRAKAFFDPQGRLSRLRCEGSVRIVTAERLGSAQRAIYDETKQKITLEEQAKLKQRGMHLQGEKVVLDLISEEVSVEGGVQGLYAPESDKPVPQKD